MTAGKEETTKASDGAARGKEPLSDKDVLDYIIREVDRRWAQESATRKAEQIHWKWKLFWTAVSGSVPALALGFTIAAFFFSGVKQGAIEQVKQEIGQKLEMDDLERVAEGLVVNVAQNVAEMQRTLGRTENEVADLLVALDKPTEVEVEQLRAILEALRQSASDDKGRFAQLLADVARHDQMLTGEIPVAGTFRVRQLQFQQALGLRDLNDPASQFFATRADGGEYYLKVDNLWTESFVALRDLDDRSSWFFGVDYLSDGVARTRLRGPDKTILQHRVVNGKDPSLEVLRHGEGRYQPYQFPPAR